MANGHDPRRPFIDTEMQERLGSFLDSLLAVAGISPDSIVSRRFRPPTPQKQITGSYDPRTRTVAISPESDDPRRTAAHELGHLFDSENPAVRERMLGRADALPGDNGEGFADTFHDAMFARLGRGVPEANSDTQLLLNLLAAASKRRKQEAKRAEDADALVDGLIRRPPKVPQEDR